MMKNILVIAMGNIGTGKTHFIESLCKRPYREFIIPDLCTTADTSKRIEDLFRVGKDVILEGIYMSKRERLFLVERIRSLFPKIIIVCFDFGRGNSSSLEARVKNPRNLTEEQWKAIHDANQYFYERPSDIEGFSRIITKSIMMKIK